MLWHVPCCKGIGWLVVKLEIKISDYGFQAGLGLTDILCTGPELYSCPSRCLQSSYDIIVPPIMTSLLMFTNCCEHVVPMLWQHWHNDNIVRWTRSLNRQAIMWPKPRLDSLVWFYLLVLITITVKDSYKHLKTKLNSWLLPGFIFINFI